MKVLKFGGTSVGSPERIRGMKKIIESQTSPCVIVVSALQGVTDELKKVCEYAAERNNEYKILLEKLFVTHSEYTSQLIISDRKDSVLDAIKNSLGKGDLF